MPHWAKVGRGVLLGLLVLPGVACGCARFAPPVRPAAAAAPQGRPPAPAASPPPAPEVQAPQPEVQLSARPAPPPPPPPALHGKDGAIPILEYHAIGPQEGRWARTPAGLRADLEQLYAEGFRPVDLRDIGASPPPIPEGTHPVVLTFDDGLPSQFGWSSAGPAAGPDPDTAAGVLWQFHLAHPDWAFAATFFVNAHPFGSDSAPKLRWLVDHGAEIGNHTYDHADLAALDPAARAAEIGRLQKYLADVLPGYEVRSFAFPYGALSDPSSVAAGQYEGVRWNFRYLALVGSGPLQSQPSGAPVEVPRIQVAAPETVPASTRRFIWWGWQQQWLPTAHLYTVTRADA